MIRVGLVHLLLLRLGREVLKTVLGGLTKVILVHAWSNRRPLRLWGLVPHFRRRSVGRLLERLLQLRMAGLSQLDAARLRPRVQVRASKVAIRDRRHALVRNERPLLVGALVHRGLCHDAAGGHISWLSEELLHGPAVHLAIRELKRSQQLLAALHALAGSLVLDRWLGEDTLDLDWLARRIQVRWAEHAIQWSVKRRDVAAALRNVPGETAVVRHVLDLREVAWPVHL